MIPWLCEWLEANADGDDACGALFAFCLLYPFAFSFDMLVAFVQGLRIGRVTSLETTRCPRGHLVELQGAFACRCGMSYAGSAFEPCPHCGEICHAITCDCGLSCVNPLTPVRREW